MEGEGESKSMIDSYYLQQEVYYEFE